ncbi:MAG TPA: hypothetical protein VL262_03995 [Vicinamibacterales bacterium]|jgi:hypothetical protein|nr:hypothetical protein [Vicinamibacterales bacterium]
MRHPIRFIAAVLLATPPAGHAQSLIHVDRRAQLARADLDYASPAVRPEEGMPVGNGRMGSLVWTTPEALHFQINRVDVHAMDSTTFSFPRADSDYGYGCGLVDVAFDTGEGAEVFAGGAFHQHLSIYDGLMTARGNGITARVLASPDHDVIAIDIDDARARPEPIAVDLRMLRYQMQYVSGRTADLRAHHANVFRTAAQTATSMLSIEGGAIALTQRYREGEFDDASGVAIAVVGRASHARYANETTVRLTTAAASGPFTILIGTAESREPSAAPSQEALAEVEAVKAGGFAALRIAAAGWWHRFWARGTVYLHSESGQADFVEQNYDFYLYLMASSSRGAYPPRFGGGVWQTDGDMSRWGSQYWWANTSAYYSGLMPANRVELMDPLFDMYTGMLDNAALAARQQWGSQGVWIPETTFFNGPEPLPDAIGRELQDLVLVREPFDARSAAFDRFAENKNRHNSRWNYRGDGTWQDGRYVFTSKGAGIFGSTTHILGVAARIGNLAWQRYQFTGDTHWLRDRAYPFIKGAAEFYRNFPNLQKDGQGIYHITHTNSGESAWNSRDASYEVACMHMILPLASNAAAVLHVDDALREKWDEVAAHLVAAKPGAPCGTGSEIALDRPYGAFVYNGPGAIEPIGPEPELKRRFLGFTRLGSFIDPQGGGGPRIFRNHMRLREGPGAIDFEHIAGLAAGLHTSLLDSHPDSLTDDAVSVFNAWPKDWDAAFTLLARGAFVISAAQEHGRVLVVEVQSQHGGRLRLTNPWGTSAVTTFRNGRKAEGAAGPLLNIATTPGETVAIVPAGQPLRRLRIL